MTVPPSDRPDLPDPSDGTGGPVRAHGSATAGDLLGLLRSGRAQTRGDLGRLTGLSRTAVTQRLDALAAAGLVRVAGELASRGGRPPRGLALDPSAGLVVAVAVGRSRVQVEVCDLAGTPLRAGSWDHAAGATAAAATAGEVLPGVRTEVAASLADLDAAPDRVRAVAVSLPATVDAARRRVLRAPVVPGWEGDVVATELGPLAGPGAPVLVANDADVLALSEWVGTTPADGPPGGGDALVVKASTGLGAGVVVSARVATGATGAAGDLGHTRGEAGGDLTCRCGRTGCLEAVAGGWALVRAYRERGGADAVDHVRDLVAAAVAGDGDAEALLVEGGRVLGEALAAAVDLLDPAVVVLGGDMAADPAFFPTYAAALGAGLARRSRVAAERDLPLLPSRHGDRAGLVGAAALALDHALAPAVVDAALERSGSRRSGSRSGAQGADSGPW